MLALRELAAQLLVQLVEGRHDSFQCEARAARPTKNSDHAPRLRLRRKNVAPGESEVDSDERRTPMQHNFEVSVGDQVFLEEGGEEIGAVRKIEHDHLVVYIEAAGDFVIRGPEVKAIHHGKVILEPEKLEPRLLEAAKGAHEREVV
jgi:hypothetical protein